MESLNNSADLFIFFTYLTCFFEDRNTLLIESEPTEKQKFVKVSVMSDN